MGTHSDGGNHYRESDVVDPARLLYFILGLTLTGCGAAPALPHKPKPMALDQTKVEKKRGAKVAISRFESNSHFNLILAKRRTLLNLNP